ncbi:sugar ABC transporter permease (plasmid) [Streptomyces goshikiensis]|uniref:carbohydrate ABC transporter permease n=1 Tax=Streptomyces goshikiensis TaxID=1942 RepID=UPI0022F38EDE|nr:sugar ABC transporter permease [Streptomyces goshikiensis]WBY24542.1 sugar ABC transporter permease [Streptomyces goshikiensis]WSY02797.1 sugar ABC transporter permease [Streptomyces goshikiensis]
MTLLPSPAKAVSPPRTRSRARRNALAGWGFAGPFAVVFALVFLAPIGYAFYLSLMRDRLIGGTSFVGADNYLQALTDARFWEGSARVGLFLVVQVPVMLGIALLVALAIDSGRLYGKAFFRVAVFLPYAVPAVVASLMWGFIYGARFGLVGNLNDAFALALPDPLSPSLVLASIGNVVTWEFVGYNTLIFYAALKVVPRSLYEAAAIDGAGEWRIVTAIKLPAIRSAVVIATIFSIIGSFQLFNEPAIMRNLAPNAITTDYTPNLYTYSLAFSGQQHNYAATIAIVMGVFTAVIAYAVQLRGMRKG